MTAHDLIFYIFQKFYSFVFSAEIEPGIKVGWILVTVTLFMIMIRSILNVPEGLGFGRSTSIYHDSTGSKVFNHDNVFYRRRYTRH